MKESRHYTMLIPEKVLKVLPQLEESINFIPGYSTDNLKEIISLISYHIRKDEDRWAPLKMGYLRKFVPQAEIYMKELIESGIIESSNSYQEGYSAKKYRFTAEYYSQYVTLDVENPKLIRRIYDSQTSLKQRNSKKYPIQNKFIRHLTIEPEAYSFIETIYSGDIEKHNYASASITRIMNDDIYYTVDNTSERYHSNLTNMPRTLRPFVRIKGVPLKNVDVKNCQPYLSTLIFTNPSKICGFAKDKAFEELLKNLEVTPTEDINRYIDLVVIGHLYEFLLKEFQSRGLDYHTREEVKKQVLIILFDRNIHNPLSRKVFAELFPEVHGIFSMVRGNEKGNKFKSYQRFAILLQRIESHIILNIILKRIYTEYPEIIAVTIHDSIMASIYTDHIETVYQIMEEELTQFVGYKPILRIE